MRAKLGLPKSYHIAPKRTSNGTQARVSVRIFRWFQSRFARSGVAFSVFAAVGRIVVPRRRSQAGVLLSVGALDLPEGEAFAALRYARGDMPVTRLKALLKALSDV